MTDLVTLNENGKLFTTSLLVAEKFEKDHKNVLQSIEELLPSLDKEFVRLNFQPIEYVDQLNRSQPCYNLSRDGFSLLAMGFTGQKALQWKVKFIEAFNKMEQELLDQKAISYRPNFDLSKAYLTTLKALVASEEDRQKLEQELIQANKQLMQARFDLIRRQVEYERMRANNQPTQVRFDLVKIQKETSDIAKTFFNFDNLTDF